MADDLRPAPDLYEEDFYLWTQRQAAALRGVRPEGVEWERVAEEVEDMGKSELRTAFSLTTRLLEHLFLLEAAAQHQAAAHWRGEVRAFRGDLSYALTPSIRRKLSAELEALHARAALIARDKLGLPGDQPAFQRRWSLAELLDAPH